MNGENLVDLTSEVDENETPLIKSCILFKGLFSLLNWSKLAAVTAAMDTIIVENAFTSSGGNLVAKKSARVVERNVEGFELV